MKALFGLFLFFNCFAILFIAINHLSINKSRILQEEHSTATTPLTQFSFDDPIAAYQVLEQLDLYEPLKNTSKIEALAMFKSYYKYHLSLTKDEDYCRKHRAHFVNNPESVFGQQVKVFSDFSGSTLLKTLVLPKVAYDIQPKIGPHLPKEMRNIQLNDIREDTSVFFCNALYWAREIGKEFSCTTQMSNHFPGDSLLYRKDYAAETLVEYKQNYSSQPGCFDNNKFFPKTWVLYKEDQCLDFFEEFNGPIYQELKKERKIVYIRKIGANSHSAMGVEPVNDVEEASIRALYQNGSLCGKVTKNYIVQYFVHNPLLVHGHKFDFRAYMLVASTNPVISYYHDGFMRVSLQKYDQNADDRSVFLTNTALAKKAFSAAAENGTHHGMDTAQLKEFHIWNMDDLQNYLYEAGVVTDPNWIENYLRPEFRKAMAHLIRMGSAPFLRDSSVYELFGLDFMLDANLNLWFIEANIFPNFEPSTAKEKVLFDSLLTDHFEIIFGLLRSKTKRIINYVNGLLRDGEAVSGPDGVEIQDLDGKIAHFKEITRNYYEPEYTPSPNNSYTIITDYNYEGVKRFSGLIEEQCV